MLNMKNQSPQQVSKQQITSVKEVKSLGKAFLKHISCVTLFLIAIIIATSHPNGVNGAVEWPVYFEHLGFVHSVHNKFDLALSVHFYLPALDLRLQKSLHRLRLLQGTNYKEDDNADSEYHDYVNPDEVARQARVMENAERESRNEDGQPSRLHELQESWATLNRHLRQRCQTLKRRSNNLKGLGMLMPPRRRRQRNRRDLRGGRHSTFGDDIIPSIFRDRLYMQQVKYRYKRQDDGGSDGGGGGFGGGFLKTVLGLAYDEDVSALVKRLNDLKGEYNQGIQTVNNQQAQLRSLTDAELSSQKTNMNKVMKMADKLDRKVSGTL